MITTERLFSHSSIKEYENDGDDQDRYYLPWRVAAEVAARQKMGQKVSIILPKHSEFEEYLELLESELLDGGRINRLYTPDNSYLMDEDIKTNLLSELLDLTHQKTILHPYKATDEFYSWAKVLQSLKGVRVYADRANPNDRFWWGHKGAYHRWIDDLSTPSFAENFDLTVPKGFIAKDKAEVFRAISIIGKKVVLKPILGAGGFRIGFCETKEDVDCYEWPIDALAGDPMPVAVQEKLDIEKDSLGERVFSLQFADGRVYGLLTRQKVSNTEWCGNIIPAGVSESFELSCQNQADQLLSCIKPTGDGGIDFADVRGIPVILEVNGGRPTGAHIPKRFKEAFAPNSAHFVFEKVDINGDHAFDVWDKLSSNKLNLSADQTGVFPLVWLYKSWGMLGSFAHTLEESATKLRRARDIIGV